MSSVNSIGHLPIRPPDHDPGYRNRIEAQRECPKTPTGEHHVGWDYLKERWVCTECKENVDDYGKKAKK